MRPLLFPALLLLIGSACDVFDELACDRGAPIVGPYEQLALPDGSTLVPWVEELEGDAVEVHVTWNDGTPFAFWAALATHEAEGELRQVGACPADMLAVRGQAVVGAWDEDFLIAAPAEAYRWRIEHEMTNTLLLASHDIQLPPEHKPFAGWEQVEDLQWRLEVLQVRGFSYAYLEWSTATELVRMPDGSEANRDRLFYTSGHPWTEPRL